jgi:hypothetical protein
VKDAGEDSDKHQRSGSHMEDDMRTDVKQWAFAVVDSSFNEFNTLIARIPPNQRSVVGKLKNWSPKDHIAHLTYWIDLFVTNIQACRKNLPLTATDDYLTMNDAAWQIRKDWSWNKIETDVACVFSDLKVQIKDLTAEDLIDVHRFTLEADQKSPRSLIQSLLYELIDHPVHHFARMYQAFGDEEGIKALLTRAQQVINQPGGSKWSTPTRDKIRELIMQNQSQNVAST